MHSYIYAHPFRTTATGSGTAAGTIALSDVQGIYVGQVGWLKSAAAGPSRVKVLKINTTSKTVTLQILPNEMSQTSSGQFTYPTVSYNPSDISGFLLANSPVISFPGQVVQVYLSSSKPGAVV